MPALKMKIKSKTNFLREYNRKSTKISKGTRNKTMLSEKQTSVYSSSPSPLTVSCNIEVSAQNIEITEANDCQDTCIGDSNQPLKLLHSSHDPVSFFGRMESLMACPANMETIFSLEQNDGQFKPINLFDSVGHERPRLPHLVIDDVDDRSCSLIEFQACNAFDFYISDNVASIPFDGGIGFSNVINGACSDYDLVNSDAMLNMAERCLLLPFLDKPLESVDLDDDKSIGKATTDFDESWLYLVTHQLKSPDQEAQIRCFPTDLEEVSFFNLPVTCSKLSNSPVLPCCSPLSSIEAEKGKHVTLVLDLDETLVHSTLERCNNADFTFPVFFNMKEHTVYVRRRPYLQMFLERVAQMFRVIIFTASQSIYAEQLLNILDPGKKLISQSLYRESCIFSDGSCTKDLTILGVDLAKVVIVDNSPQVFRLQLNNGIPIRSWFDDPADQALNLLLPFLETLAVVDDVRPLIAERYANKEEQQLSTF